MFVESGIPGSCDPFYMPYGSLNLRPEVWEEAQRNKKLLSLTKEIKDIVDQGLIACVPKEDLNELCFELYCNCELRWIHDWEFVDTFGYCNSSMCIAIISHSAIENRKDGKIRFQKSPHDNEAYLPENIVSVPDKTCRWGKWVLKSSLNKPVIEEKPLQGSLF